jgi:cyclase
MSRRIPAIAAILVCSLTVAGQNRTSPQRTEIAPGIHLFATAPYGDAGLDGNSIAIVSSDGVMVFDTNGTPAASAAVLAQIRALTDRPVRYVVNSHWHWDHWYGTETYLNAFPDVKIITHEKNRAMMAGPAVAFNRPFMDEQLPAYLKSLEQRAAQSPAAKETLDADRWFYEQKKNARLVLPNVTFSERLTIEMGDRHIEVLNFGRGVTPGDTVVYLPKEKLLLAGDLIVNPITFALSGYPTEWLEVLKKIDALDATTIVTGHGPALRDKTLLHATMDVFRVLLKEGARLKAEGKSADEARDAIVAGLRDLMVRITGDDPQRNGAFKQQLVDWYLHRVYEELDGPLSDAIAPIPPR